MPSWILAAGFFLCLFRVYSIFPSARISKNLLTLRPPDTRSLAVFLGSGGHTSEALSLLSGLSFKRYTPRIYIIADGDNLSAQKAAQLEERKAIENNPQKGDPARYSIVTIRRARRVHQSLVSTPPTMLLSLLDAVYHITIAPLFCSPSTPFADVLLLNGPGTCFVLCLAVYLNKFFGLPSPRLFYIESFARVNSLSLSGKLLRPFVDRFIVQWPQPIQNHSQGEYHGWLV